LPAVQPTKAFYLSDLLWEKKMSDDQALHGVGGETPPPWLKVGNSRGGVEKRVEVTFIRLIHSCP
jgi:hypothetical protein